MIFQVLGILYYDPCDIYNIKVKDKTYNCIMLNDEINITQGIEEIIHLDLPEESETDYTKADKTDRKINQTYLIVDKQNQKIESVITQIGDRSDKTTSITQDIDRIEQKVQDVEDLTYTVTGIKTVIISDAYPNENILELHIYGNNAVFNYLYPEDDLYPEDTLYPYGDSRIRFYNDNEDKTIELGIEEVLRANDEVRDELFINNNEVYLIRRVNADGTTKTEEVSTLLGTLDFVLTEGNNTFEIVNYLATISVRYVQKNDFTDRFATKVEMNSSISQTANEINLKVDEKLDEEDFTSANIMLKINNDESSATINADKINLNGVVTANQNFKIKTDGSMEAKNGTFTGGKIDLTQIGETSSDNPIFRVKKSDILTQIGADGLLVLQPEGNNLYIGRAKIGTNKNNPNNFEIECYGGSGSDYGYFIAKNTEFDTYVSGDARIWADNILMAASSEFTSTASLSKFNELKCTNLIATGTKNRAVKIDNEKYVLLNAYETATPFFGDVGSDETDAKGYCKIDIEKIFKQTIELENYKVFIQECGEGKLYVKKYNDYFEVVGTPNLKFDWELKAIQKNYKNTRLEIKELKGEE